MLEQRLLGSYSDRKASSNNTSYMKNTKSPPQLRYLGMEWIMIKDDYDKLQSPYQKGFHHKGTLSVKYSKEKNFQFDSYTPQKDTSTTRTKLPSIATGRSAFEEEIMNDVRNIINKEKHPRINFGAKSEALLIPHDIDLSPKSPETASPMNHDDFHKLIRTLDNVSITSTDKNENQDSFRNNLVRSLVKMMESNAEYEDLLKTKGKNLPVSTKKQRKNSEELRDDEEKRLKARRNGEMGFKSNPRMFFVSPTGVVSASALNTNTDPDVIIQSDAKKESNEEKNRQVLANENFSIVFETGNNKGIGHQHHKGPEKYLSDDLDYEIFLKAQKEKRKEISVTHEMKDLLGKFASKPGKKIYESPAISHEKIRLEAELKKSPSSKELSVFPLEPHNHSPKKIELPQITPNKRKADIVDENQVTAEIREKSLAELLFERFKAKLPEIQQNAASFRTQKKKHDSRRLIDNAFNRRKNYDAWYLSPNMRSQKLKTFLNSAEKL